jgi:hypothetical protein
MQAAGRELRTHRAYYNAACHTESTEANTEADRALAAALADPAVDASAGHVSWLFELHLLAMANVLRRPILLLSNCANDNCGLFLPTRHAPAQCRVPGGPGGGGGGGGTSVMVMPAPLVVARNSQSGQHFVALAPCVSAQALPEEAGGGDGDGDGGGGGGGGGAGGGGWRATRGQVLEAFQRVPGLERAWVRLRSNPASFDRAEDPTLQALLGATQLLQALARGGPGRVALQRLPLGKGEAVPVLVPATSGVGVAQGEDAFPDASVDVDIDAMLRVAGVRELLEAVGYVETAGWGQLDAVSRTGVLGVCREWPVRTSTFQAGKPLRRNLAERLPAAAAGAGGRRTAEVILGLVGQLDSHLESHRVEAGNPPRTFCTNCLDVLNNSNSGQTAMRPVLLAFADALARWDTGKGCMSLLEVLRITLTTTAVKEHLQAHSTTGGFDHAARLLGALAGRAATFAGRADAFKEARLLAPCAVNLVALHYGAVRDEAKRGGSLLAPDQFEQLAAVLRACADQARGMPAEPKSGSYAGTFRLLGEVAQSVLGLLACVRSRPAALSTKRQSVLAKLLLGVVDTAADAEKVRATPAAEAGSAVWTAALQALGVLVEAERGTMRGTAAAARPLRALVVKRLAAPLEVVHRAIAEHETGGFGAAGGAFAPPVAQCIEDFAGALARDPGSERLAGLLVPDCTLALARNDAAAGAPPQPPPGPGAGAAAGGAGGGDSTGRWLMLVRVEQAAVEHARSVLLHEICNNRRCSPVYCAQCRYTFLAPRPGEGGAGQEGVLQTCQNKTCKRSIQLTPAMMALPTPRTRGGIERKSAAARERLAEVGATTLPSEGRPSLLHADRASLPVHQRSC